MERRVDIATQYWQLTAEQFPEWQQVHSRIVSAGEVRRDFIHSHGIVLHALGKIGNDLLRKSTAPEFCADTLSKLRTIDWHRTNAGTWEGRATIGGKVSKGASNVLLTTAYIRTMLGLPLPPEEQRAEDAFNKGEM